MKTTRSGNDVNLGVPRSLRKLLNFRLLDEGWSNVSQFRKGTGLPYSLETVRRAFNDCPYKNLDTITLAVIMQYLNYSPKEIKTILARHLNPNDPVLKLIGDQTDAKMNIPEENLISIYRAIVAKEPELSNTLADHLDLLGKIANVPTRQNTNALRR